MDLSTDAQTTLPAEKEVQETQFLSVLVDVEYEEWKRVNNLMTPLSRAEYVLEFDPCSVE